MNLNLGHGCMDFLLLYRCFVDIRGIFRHWGRPFAILPTNRYITVIF